MPTNLLPLAVVAPPHHRLRRRAASLATAIAACIACTLPAAGLASPDTGASAAATHANVGSTKAESGAEQTAPEVRYVADWIARSQDHGGNPFLIIDKRHARLLVFDAQAHLVASAPVLLGLAKGDHTVPGIGDKKLADIRPDERTTPAGRFVGEGGMDLRGEDVVWIDYDAAVSMHRVLTTNPRERRQQRLDTPSTLDNRISYGCVNVPTAFFDRHIAPMFANEKQAIIYVMPEVKTLHATFPRYDGPELATATSAPQKRIASAP